MFARIMIIGMKKVLYILVAVVGVLATSCSKENIQPTAQTSDPVPQWKSYATPGEDEDSEGSGEITDPNSDRDDNSRRKFN